MLQIWYINLKYTTTNTKRNIVFLVAYSSSHHEKRSKRFNELVQATAQVNLPSCSPHCPFNAERQAGKL